MKVHDAHSKPIKPVAIIGGGITGLTAAFRLRECGIPVKIYEAGARVGGAINSIRREGYLVEAGPNTILETSPKVAELVSNLGLDGRKLYSDPAAKNRYVVHNRKLVNMPSSPLGFIGTPLFSAAAKLRLLAEPFITRAPEIREESVSTFVVRRLGHQFLDHAIDALVSGVYAGDPEKLSVPQAFPRLHKLEQRYGSLVKGQLFGARDRKRNSEVAKPNAPKFSFDEGLQVLTDTLYEKLCSDIRFYSPVIKLEQRQSGWIVTIEEGGFHANYEHSAVLYAGTAFRLPEITLAPGHYLNCASLSEIYYPPVASVVLGFRREQIAHPLDGFGMLIPRVEGFNILGTIFSSSLFPNRAPAGHVTLTSYVGGARCPELATRTHDELFELVRADLSVLLGATGSPTFQHCTVFPKAIPQYDVGFGRFRALMSQIEAKAPGLFLAGHYRDGISLADSIVSGYSASDRIDRFFVQASIDDAASGQELHTQKAA